MVCSHGALQTSATHRIQSPLKLPQLLSHGLNCLFYVLLLPVFFLLFRNGFSLFHVSFCLFVLLSHLLSAVHPLLHHHSLFSPPALMPLNSPFHMTVFVYFIYFCGFVCTCLQPCTALAPMCLFSFFFLLLLVCNLTMMSTLCSSSAPSLQVTKKIIIFIYYLHEVYLSLLCFHSCSFTSALRGSSGSQRRNHRR